MMFNQNQDQSGQESVNDQPIPPPPIEFGPEEISPPTFPRMEKTNVAQEVPADVKEMNRTIQIPLFIGMGILAIVLLALIAYFLV